LTPANATRSIREVQVYEPHAASFQVTHAAPSSPVRIHLLRALVHTDNHGVITLERLKRKLLLGLDAHLPQLGDFLCEDGFGRGGRVDAVGLDRDNNAAADLEEEASVETDDTGLVGLGDVGEDAVYHADQHAVLEGMTGNSH
jgi:hypothetical protein